MSVMLRWSASARDDLAAIISFIARDNPAAAREMRARIEASVLPLAEHPYLFRAGRVLGTRELVAHPNYLVVYRVAADAVEITAVVHARQEYP